MANRYQNTSGIFKTGSLIKTGQSYQIVLQTAADIDAMLALQAVVMDTLSSEEKSYLVPKDRAFFEKHFASDNLVLGIKVDGQLVAQSVIVNPTRKNPKTGMTDMPGRLAPERVTVIQGVIVHPDFRGNRLMTRMVDAWLNIARSEGRRHAIAEVTSDNHFSWSVFMKEGLHLHSIGYDPEDAVHLYNMHASVKQLITARLHPAFNSVAPKNDLGKPTAANTDIAGQKKLLGLGFKGVARDSRTGHIIFDKSAAVSAPPAIKKIFSCNR